ncbi:hypothetical protein Tco_1541533 [Tanacetum coccineum]
MGYRWPLVCIGLTDSSKFQKNKRRQLLLVLMELLPTGGCRLDYAKKILWKFSWMISRLIRWVLLLQGFNIKIKDKKGAENLAADHLSRLENPNMRELAKEETADKFPLKHLDGIKRPPSVNDKVPWYYAGIMSTTLLESGTSINGQRKGEYGVLSQGKELIFRIEPIAF